MELLKLIDKLMEEYKNLKFSDKDYHARLFQVKQDLTSARIKFLRELFKAYNLGTYSIYPKQYEKNYFILDVEFNKLNGTIVRKFVVIQDISLALNLIKKLIRIGGISVTIQYEGTNKIKSINKHFMDSQFKSILDTWNIKPCNNINQWTSAILNYKGENNNKILKHRQKFIKINKIKAQKLFNEGYNILIAPSNYGILKDTFIVDVQINNKNTDNFENFVDKFISGICNNKVGKYPIFYVSENILK